MKPEQDLGASLVEVFRALGDPTRLRLLGLIAERPRTGKELGELVDVGLPTVSHHMDKLVRSGLVSVTREGQSRRYALDQRTLTALSRLALGSNGEPTVEHEVRDPEAAERAKLLRDFFDGERLKQIPAQRKKRVIVLQYLLERFDPAHQYSEREVNDLLRPAHEDVATLRRELVDYGYMD